MCALTKSSVPEFDTAEPSPASASTINFALLKELARLDGQLERHGSLVGTSAVTALLLQELVGQVKCISTAIAAMKIQDQGAGTPAGSTAAPAPATTAPGSRFGVVASVDAASVQAISSGVAAVLTQTMQHPLAEIRGMLKTQGDSLTKLDAVQAADGKRLDGLEPQAAALQNTVDEILQRLDRIDRAALLTGRQLLKLHGAVGGLSADIAGFEEMTEAVRRHVEALDIEVAAVAGEVEREGADRTAETAKRAGAARKPKHS